MSFCRQSQFKFSSLLDNFLEEHDGKLSDFVFTARDGRVIAFHEGDTYSDVDFPIQARSRPAAFPGFPAIAGHLKGLRGAVCSRCDTGGHPILVLADAPLQLAFA